MHRTTRFCLILLGLLAQAAPAFAFHPLITDDTGTQGTGGNQIETGYDYGWSRDNGNSETYRAVPFTYTRGLLDNIDAYIGSGYQLHPSSGWEDAEAGIKWRFYDNEQDRLSLALKPAVLIPLATSDESAVLGNGEISYGLTFILSKETAFGELHFNLAAERNNYDDPGITDRKNLYRASIAPVWKVNERWTLAFDTGIQTNPDSTKHPETGFVELGAVYSPGEDLELSLGLVRQSLGTSANSAYATFGVTWCFR
jgi:hypothetical protein